MRLHWRLLRPAVAVRWILSTLLRFEKVWLLWCLCITLSKIGLYLREQVFLLTDELLIRIAVSRFDCVIRWWVMVHIRWCHVKIVVGRAMWVSLVVDASTDWYRITSRLVDPMIVFHFSLHWWLALTSLRLRGTILEVERSCWWECIIAVIPAVQVISFSLRNLTSWLSLVEILFYLTVFDVHICRRFNRSNYSFKRSKQGLSAIIDFNPIFSYLTITIGLFAINRFSISVILKIFEGVLPTKVCPWQ